MILHDYECLGLNVIGVDASQNSSVNWQVWKNLRRSVGLSGKGFIDVFDEEAHKIERCEMAGTRYHLS